jgi:tetratricopeptide (TPR) repeat protein
MAVFNSALCYENAGNLELAVARYESCAEIGYQVPNVFLFISSLYRDAGRDEDALKTLAYARGLYPREQSLIIEEQNIDLTNDEFDKAKENLTLAAEQDPTNEILWFSLGSVLDNLGNSEEAIEAYLKALDVKADYFDANYNLGALYFNQAVQGINAANDMWKPRMTKSESDAQKTLENDAKALFETAKPYLESAHASQPGDVETMRSLRDIYARTGEDDKMIDINNRLKAISE